jgi:hypothetical protein
MTGNDMSRDYTILALEKAESARNLSIEHSLGGSMKSKIKWLLITASVVAITIFVPIVFTTLTSRGTSGYFYAGECACGYANFNYMEGDGFYSYNPRHKDTRRSFTLRPRDASWELVKTNGAVFSLLRIDGDEVYYNLSPTFPRNTNWYRMKRVYNIWRVWIPRVLPEE